MTRDTVGDRERKSRIREREYRLLMRRLTRLEGITEDQTKALKKVQAAEAKSEPLKATSLKTWRELREMGIVREKDGTLYLTSVGTQYLADGE